MEKMAAIILAAGQGTRMKSAKPKVLHRVAGKPLITFPCELAQRLGVESIVVVVGHGRQEVEATARESIDGVDVAFALQAEQKGTGHAVLCALPRLRGHKGPVLILSGDVPLLDKPSISRMKKAYNKTGGPMAFLSFTPEDAAEYGRVIRDSGGRPVAIREFRDCSVQEKKIGEVNSGIYLIDMGFLRQSVKRLESNNSQKEFYLTDLLAMAAKKHEVAVAPVAAEVVNGVNDRIDLARIERVLQKKTNQGLMRGGVTMPAPDTVYVDLSVKVGADTEIGPSVQLRGSTKIGRGCRIEAGAVITDSTIKDGAQIKAYSVLEEAIVGPQCSVGPMGRLRPGTVLEKGAKVGNFVELKKTRLGPGSKASHLAYLGDGEIGRDVNVGAGTIFCNYDGFSKHKTVLCDDVFIGSDSQIVAPVTVGKGAYVASGSTITRDVPADDLAISRAKQENKKGVAAVMKRRLKALKERADAAKGKKK
jgi:bifunctional UDP-N-acetylglucosamine pyrophosphorylase / glucosamine-1-phosphate N-acetyltransferase